MRRYVSETDFHIIEEATKLEPTLTSIAQAFRQAGLEWPPGFNYDNSPYARLIDRDIIRAWSATRPQTPNE